MSLEVDSFSIFIKPTCMQYLSHKNMEHLKIIILVLFLVSVKGYSRSIMTAEPSKDFELVSGGMHNTTLSYNSVSSTITCTPMYGFLPCAPNLWGYIFLIVVYQYLLYLGDSFLSQGSGLLFNIIGPGFIGASAFQLLDSLTHLILVLASGYSSSQETAQAEVAAGMSFLAGSTVFVLTLVLGTCIVVGNVDISQYFKSVTTRNSKPLSFFSSTVTTDVETRYAARIMLLSNLPFLIAQLPHMIGSSSSTLGTLIALVVSVVILISYFLFQVFQPWIQNRRHEYVKQKFVKNIFVEKLLTKDGKPDVAVIKELFHKTDRNNDNYITPPEIKGLILGLQFREVGLENDDFVEMVLKEFDEHIDEKEFVRGISKWISDFKELGDKEIRSSCQLNNHSSQETEERQVLLATKENNNVKVVKNNSLLTYLKAASLILLGICILVLLASPFLDTVVGFSNSVNIPPIYVSFVLVPAVLNYKTAIAAIKSIRRKTETSASITLSQIYTTAFMNNILGITTFLFIVYTRGLVWNFSAEVIVVVHVCIVMGIVGSINNTFNLWSCLMPYALYPVSLVLLYFLAHVVV